jgi:uncharacterized UPF0160 family protein
LKGKFFAIIVGHYKKSLLKDNHQISSIKFDTLMDKVHKTFHYMDMTCDVAFISSAIFNLRRVGLPDVFATFIYSSSPPHQKKKPAVRMGKQAAKKCYRMYHCV